MANSDSAGCNDTISIYEKIDAEGEASIQFCVTVTRGKKKVFEDGDSFFESLSGSGTSFCGNSIVAKRILALGWDQWEDEIDFDANYKLIECVGMDCGGELNLNKIKKQLEKFPRQNIVVFRNVYKGDEEIDINQLNANELYTPECFEVDDELEAARMIYQSKN